MPSLFQFGDFTLHSGRKSRWKIDCDALTDVDIQTLAYMVASMVGAFASVEGIPRGGLRLAEALKPYAVTYEAPHLIVDDVLTTGRSMEDARYRSNRKCVGAVIFGRAPMTYGLYWVKALFEMGR